MIQHVTDSSSDSSESLGAALNRSIEHNLRLGAISQPAARYLSNRTRRVSSRISGRQSGGRVAELNEDPSLKQAASSRFRLERQRSKNAMDVRCRYVYAEAQLGTFGHIGARRGTR